MCSMSRPESLYGAVSARLGGLDVPPKPTVSTILCKTPARRGGKAGSGGAGGGEASVPAPRVRSDMALGSSAAALDLWYSTSPPRQPCQGVKSPRRANERQPPCNSRCGYGLIEKQSSRGTRSVSAVTRCRDLENRDVRGSGNDADEIF